MLIWTFLSALAFLIFLVWYLASHEEKNRCRLGLLCIVSICLNCGLSLIPIQEKIKLGLDLKGGTAYLIQLEGEPTPKALEQATAVIRKRIDKFGLSEPIIQPTGTNRISVQIPGLSEENKNAARLQLSRVARLEFRLVHPNSAELLSAVKAGHEKLPLEYTVLPYLSRDDKGTEIKREMIVKRRPEMSGKHVKKAFRGFDEVGRATVVIEFTQEGSRLFGQLTGANIGNQMAIVLDDEVKSAPSINVPIFGTAIISGGNMTANEADELSSVLENPLETPVKILEERGVDPSLGRDSIESGRKAGLLALALVIALVSAYYRKAGLVAVIALAVNLLLLLGCLAQFGFTLTLPGIAGIVLTIGMAVDANVLIYERIRDELALGKPLKAAIQGGFDRAFSAIFDSNITTVIPAIIVMSLGSGPLQGFAVTLTVGIIANLFAALVVTRNCFEWLLFSRKLKNLSMMQFINKPSFDFLKLRYAVAVLSLTVIVIGMITFQQRIGRLLGVDFAGGDSITMTCQQPVSVHDIRAALEKNETHPSMIQFAGGENKLMLQFPYGESDRAETALHEAFPAAGFLHASKESVGAIIGEELKARAVLALALGFLAIVAYVALRYEWSFAWAAGIAQLHNVLITVGLMALLGREFNMTLVGAFLTILGYSINDKIVIFDRIREGIRMGEHRSLYETINHALNLTLARTLMTGGTVILAIVSLLIFGGAVIYDFALAMLIGVFVGIYSSHLVAPALAFSFSRLRQERSGRRLRIEPVKTAV